LTHEKNKRGKENPKKKKKNAGNRIQGKTARGTGTKTKLEVEEKHRSPETVSTRKRVKGARQKKKQVAKTDNT